MADLISCGVVAVALLALVFGIVHQRSQPAAAPPRPPRRIRTTAGRVLRDIADVIDRPHAPRGTHLSFTFERGEGLRIRHDRRGCPLWYLSDADYQRAYTEADCTNTALEET